MYLEGDPKYNRNLEMILCSSTNSTLELTCPQNYSLRLESVLYGRDDPWTCTDPTLTDGVTQNCTSLEAIALLKSSCEGNTRCVYTVDSSSFGGMCADVMPYFRVNYTCIGEYVRGTLNVCTL